MKNLIFAFILTLAAFTAQAENNKKNLSQEATTITRQLAAQIELNEMEYIQVRNFTLEKLEEAAHIQEMYATNPDLRDTKLNDIEQAYQFRIQNLLNLKQFEQYLALNNRFQPQMNLIAVSEE